MLPSLFPWRLCLSFLARREAFMSPLQRFYFGRRALVIIPCLISNHNFREIVVCFCSGVSGVGLHLWQLFMDKSLCKLFSKHLFHLKTIVWQKHQPSICKYQFFKWSTKFWIFLHHKSLPQSNCLHQNGRHSIIYNFKNISLFGYTMVFIFSFTHFPTRTS